MFVKYLVAKGLLKNTDTKSERKYYLLQFEGNKGQCIRIAERSDYFGHFFWVEGGIPHPRVANAALRNHTKYSILHILSVTVEPI